MISSNPHYIAGRKKFEAQDFHGALEDYNRCIEAEENPNVYSERGVVFFYLKELDKSLADMNHAADLEPENPYRYSSRAYIKDAMGDLEGAIKDYEKAVELDPEDSIAYNNLGLLQEKLGYKQKAQKNFKRADELADVDELLQQIRKEQKDQARTEANTKSKHLVPDQDNTDADRNERKILAILRETFTTRSGFKEYLRFIQNGFKS
jgi:tetratricopeptide (TPR) repeat protein